MMFTFRNFIRLSTILSIVLLLTRCEKESNMKAPPIGEPIDTVDTVTVPVIDSLILSHQDSMAVAKLPAYFRFLDYFRKQGYHFYDFRTYLEKELYKLPEKMLVIRHDVHYRDIPSAYDVLEIEKIVIGPGHSTFYVMLNDPLELANPNFHGETEYLKLIRYLDTNQVDIQPHISPVDMYIAEKHPYWQSLSVDSIKKLFAANYQWSYSHEGTEIITTGTDVFDIADMNKTILSLLPAFNEEWKRETNHTVQGYAAHGSSTHMNYVLNNAYLLDQIDLLESGVYQYDTYNTLIFNILTYLSDNTLPAWMKHPDTVEPGRYQFLAHPYQWKYLR